MIPISNEAAASAIMNTNRQIFRDQDSALGTQLRGILGGNFDYFAPSFFRFEAKDIEELKPSRIIHRFIEGTEFSIPRVHLFNIDNIVFFNQLVGDLKVEIPTLISYMLISFSNKEPSFLPTTGALLFSREGLLPPGEEFLALLEKAGILNLLAFRGSEEGLAAYVNSNLFISFGQGLGWDIITTKIDKPFVTTGSLDSDGLYPTLNRSRELDSKSTDISDGKPIPFEFVAILIEGKRLVPVFALKSRIARSFSALNPTEESLESFV